MVGIVSFGSYVPFNRLERKRIAEAVGEPAAPGEKAVANYDEDSVSMAVEAALDCLAGFSAGEVGNLYFATTTAPYREKQSSSTIAAALDVPANVRTLDFTGSLRSGSGALLAGFDAVKAGSGKVLVTCADCRLGAPQSQWEQVCGDGAAAFLLGDGWVIASLEGSRSTSAEVFSQWRSDSDRFIASWEERFYVTQGYNRYVKDTVGALLKEKGLEPKDIARIVLYGPNPRYQAALAQSMGFAMSQVQDSLFMTVGLAGAANVPMMLAAALEEAKPGDYILAATFGEGCDALLFRATDNAGNLPPRRGVSGFVRSKKNTLIYHTYLKWRRIVETEPPRRPDPARPSAPAMFRERRKKYAFYGSRCRACGTPQFPPQRVCVHCRARDEMEQYCFVGRPARVATYTIDHLTFSQDPPAVFAVVDFEGGGRMICEMTDCDIARIDIGMEVEMSFRRLYEAGGVSNYFWKARPKR
ncbi:MAG: OB-fold domain-containing protein [Peptococcaceae bacterium]|nr:OB-fold domain-containing protein [Peptococcaceae bacterium]